MKRRRFLAGLAAVVAAPKAAAELTQETRARLERQRLEELLFPEDEIWAVPDLSRVARMKGEVLRHAVPIDLLGDLREVKAGDVIEGATSGEKATVVFRRHCPFVGGDDAQS